MKKASTLSDQASSILLLVLFKNLNFVQSSDIKNV
jgi:hypothetical protein